MGAINVRKIPDEVHRAIRARAAENGRSTEAEVRAILAQTVMREGRIKLGSHLYAISQKYGGGDFDVTRDPAPLEPAKFD